MNINVYFSDEEMSHGPTLSIDLSVHMHNGQEGDFHVYPNGSSLEILSSRGTNIARSIITELFKDESMGIVSIGVTRYGLVIHKSRAVSTELIASKVITTASLINTNTVKETVRFP